MLYRPNDFYVGQRVMVRDWDDMMEEYGGDRRTIDTPLYCFVLEMKPMCGKIAQIIDMPQEEWRGTIRVLLDKWEDDEGCPTDTFSLTGHATEWLFSTAMLEPVEQRELKFSFDSEAFNRMLGVS